MGSLWNYLQPSDEDMQKAYNDKLEDAFKYFEQLKGVDDLNDKKESSADKLKKDLQDQFLCNINKSTDMMCVKIIRSYGY
jgi:hypothetical protein